MTDNFAHRANDWDSPEKIKMTDTFVAAVLKKTELSNTWKGLEIGAGTGLVGLQILPKIKEMVFEDTSEAMLNVLKQKLNGTEPVEIVHGEIFEYNKQDIDFVCSCMAFHHIPDIDLALNHLSQICKKDALIAIGDIRTEDGSFHRFEPIPHKGFDTDKLTKQFESAGFSVLSADTYNVMKRERTPGLVTEYEQFLLIAIKK